MGAQWQLRLRPDAPAQSAREAGQAPNEALSKLRGEATQPNRHERRKAAARARRKR